MPRRAGDASTPAVRGVSDLTQLASGTWSTVYRGMDDELGRRVAVKVMADGDADDTARRSFQREVEVARALQHEWIAPVLRHGTTPEGRPYLVMELFQDGSAADRLREHGPFPPADVLRIGTGIAGALDAAHDAGIVHSDVKPENVLLSGRRAALSDFGVAKLREDPDEAPSDLLTPTHAAPEVLLAPTASRAADVYSLGSTLYTMLAGRPPFVRRPGEPLLRFHARVLDAPAPPIARTGVPPELEEVLQRALAKQAGARYPTAGEMRDALAAVTVAPAGGAEGTRSRWAPPAAASGAADEPDTADEPEPEPEPEPATVGAGRRGAGRTPAAARPPRRRPEVGEPAHAEPDGLHEPTIERLRTRLLPEDRPTAEATDLPPWWRNWPTAVAGVLAAAAVAVVVVVMVPGGKPASNRTTTTVHTLTTVPAPKLRPSLLPTLDHGTTILLTWRDNTGGHAQYEVVTVPAGGRATTSAPSSVNFFAAVVVPDRKYCFEILTLDVQGSTLYSVPPVITCPRGGTMKPVPLTSGS